MPFFSLFDLKAAADLVHALVPPTPQYAWPLLAQRTGAGVWVKHGNHTAVGACKIRGGITYMDWLKRSGAKADGGITVLDGRTPAAWLRANIISVMLEI